MAATNVSQLAGVTSGKTLGQDDFLKLLVTQMQSQDPFDPMKDTDFVAQIAQFSSLQSLQTLNASFDQTLKLQQLTGGADLIGKTVSYSLDGAAAQQGKVSGVQVQNGAVLLQVDKTNVPLDSIKTVLSA